MPTIKNLVFEGGGVKGVAYVGALQVLEERDTLKTIEQVAGASAGALTALLIALGYSIAETKNLLAVDLNQFTDGYKLKLLRIASAAKTFGAHPGNALRAWAAGLVANALGNKEATFSDLHDKVLQQGALQTSARFRDVHMIGTNLSTQQAETLSYYTTPSMPLADAVRVSMSIPIFFQPKLYTKTQDGLVENPSGNMYVDGGLIDNFPIALFDNGYPNPETLGFRVAPPEEIAVLRDKQKLPGQPITTYLQYGAALLNSAMNAQTKTHQVDNFRTIYINTGAIETTQFTLSEPDKQALVNAGIEATRAYFAKLDTNPLGKEPGNRVVDRQWRLEKYDRYALYSKVSQIYYHKDDRGGGRIQVFFALAPEIDKWALQRQVAKYYERLIGQVGLFHLEHAKQPSGEHVLTLLTHERLIDELEKWLLKHPIPRMPAFIREETLIVLAKQSNTSRPTWMTLEEKHRPLRQELLQWVSLGALVDVNRCLAQGAPVHAADTQGNGVLHLASAAPQPALLQLLLDNHASVNAVNAYGDTPLHVAVKHDRSGESIAVLCQGGAHINVCNKQGLTPLMVAVSKGHLQAVKCLIDQGAQMELTDLEGYTALSKAQHYGHTDIADYLKAHAIMHNFAKSLSL